MILAAVARRLSTGHAARDAARRPAALAPAQQRQGGRASSRRASRVAGRRAALRPAGLAARRQRRGSRSRCCRWSNGSRSAGSRALVTSGTVTSAQLLGAAPAGGRDSSIRAARRSGFLQTLFAHWRPDLGLIAESELWPNMIVGGGPGENAARHGERADERALLRALGLRARAHPGAARQDRSVARANRRRRRSARRARARERSR